MASEDSDIDPTVLATTEILTAGPHVTRDLAERELELARAGAALAERLEAGGDGEGALAARRTAWHRAMAVVIVTAVAERDRVDGWAYLRMRVLELRAALERSASQSAMARAMVVRRPRSAPGQAT